MIRQVTLADLAYLIPRAELNGMFGKHLSGFTRQELFAVMVHYRQVSLAHDVCSLGGVAVFTYGKEGLPRFTFTM